MRFIVGMPLLFVVSGMGVRYAMRTRSAGAFARERPARPLAPLTASLVMPAPPVSCLARLGQPGFREPYWRSGPWTGIRARKQGRTTA